MIALASNSPRRKELLSLLNIEYVCVEHGDESSPDLTLSPADCVIKLSREKAMSASSEYPVLAADTLVFLDGAPLGKPKDEADAYLMLSSLSGRTHEVYTGVTISYKDKIISRAVCSHVTFKTLTPELINAYIRSKEPLDKAGSYGVNGKGGILVERVEGDVYNVIGLPIATLHDMLHELSIDITENW